MGNRGTRAAFMAAAVLLAVIAAVALNGPRGSNQTAASKASPTPRVYISPAPSASASTSAAASPSATPSAQASASAAPTVAPTSAPTATAQPAGTGTGTGTGSGGTASACSAGGTGGSGPGGYPAQIQAGRAYSYCGPRAFISHATDSGESASGVCAGINQDSQAFPSGYRGVHFVGVVFRDGQIVSAGYTRDSSGANRDFGSIQDGNGSNQRGTPGRDPGAGSHNYCVNRSGSQWVMTRDGVQIFATADEPATSLASATIKFDSDVQTAGSPAAQNFTFTVPGFHDILVGGQGPRQLRGAAYYS